MKYCSDAAVYAVNAMVACLTAALDPKRFAQFKFVEKIWGKEGRKEQHLALWPCGLWRPCDGSVDQAWRYCTANLFMKQRVSVALRERSK